MSGNYWSIKNGQIVVNGKTDVATSRVTQLAYIGGVIWQENADNLWWSATSPTSGWLPPGGTAASPITNPAAPPLRDSAGNTWSIINAQAAVNGKIDQSTGRVTSLAIVAVIFFGTWGLLKSSVAMSLDRVPDGIAPVDVEQSLAALPGVERVHDLHVWHLSTTDVALTCHLVMPGGCPGDRFLHDAGAMLHDRFEIGHATIQVERGDDEPCRQTTEHSV